ncbi:glycine--tRNA ligase subunit beta [Nitrospina watsonii]|uniref:Glycine--tRNA ligase beta subunit n=1 Tax=Nitrospina watsonii TaxID=1323948 RepID=A0ABM9HHP5_9BACT|nr:glycine--tRNA ligase subunit beta [Nitrospina watsonii]CAI2719566.1 Glycine--tRNA ligase beta subunit [Nitrospina watsonii]
MPELFFEIGTEEIPAGYIEPALKHLSGQLSDYLEKHRLHAGKPVWVGTPRRLAVCVPDIAARQEDVVETHLGPSVNIAYDEEGNPTKVAIGFAKGKGIEVSELTREATPKGEVLCARVAKTGQPTADILNAYLPELFGSIPFPKKMRWADGKLAFARPVHWIVALFDSQPLAFEFGGIAAGTASRGHRFLKPDAFPVTGFDDYLKQAEAHCLVVDPTARLQRIRQQLDQLASEVGGAIREDTELLDTVTYLVEYPVTLRGEFEARYLELPQELLVITMKHHQKYFPVWKGDDLLPYFLAVSNMKTEDGTLIRQGNQRVLRARLDDARFFYDEDRKHKLEEFVEELNGVVFQKDLGTVYERTERIQALVTALTGEIQPGQVLPVDAKATQRAAMLCKADLVTQMVYEFPELQGVMGGYYALHAGEGEDVATAIKEHYKPAFAGDSVPSTMTGALVAIADKLDTIVSCIGVGLIPSGSEDPYALRRNALGIIQILLKYDLQTSLEWLIDRGIAILGGKAKLAEDKIRYHCLELFSQRLKTLLTQEGFEYDVIDAVLGTRVDSFKDIREKAVALSDLKKQPYFETLAIAFRRVASIIEGQVPDAVDAALLKEEPERELYAQWEAMQPTVESCLNIRDYSSALAKIVEIKPAVDRFFDGVMVNVDDAALRQNRMALLKAVSGLFSQLADFSRIVVKKS